MHNRFSLLKIIGNLPYIKGYYLGKLPEDRIARLPLTIQIAINEGEFITREMGASIVNRST